MRFLGRMRGSGTLTCGDQTIGPADYELDGYMIRPGADDASGELRMASGELQRVFGRHGLRLVTSDGQVLHLRFTGKQSDARGDAAHVDISEGLPPPKKWRH